MPVPTPGRSVRERREAARLTREQLALRSGVSTSTLARLELTNHLPNARALARIAETLDITVDSLLALADTAGAA